MDDLYCFDTIPGTPARYYKKFPEFYNVQCQKILALWEGGVWTDEQLAQDEEKENIPPQPNKKRTLNSEEEDRDILENNACDTSL